MKWLLRPSILVLVLFALAASAAALALWPRTPVNRALPLSLPAGDQEIVWLYPATNAVPWERFVSAFELAQEADSSAAAFTVDKHNAFPDRTTAVPEVALSFRGSKGKLWFRWYKITSDLKSQDWVAALVARRPAPLAIIGGGTSEGAVDPARTLPLGTDQPPLGPPSPFLLLATVPPE